MVWMLTGRKAKPEKSHVKCQGRNWRFCHLVCLYSIRICAEWRRKLHRLTKQPFYSSGAYQLVQDSHSSARTVQREMKHARHLISAVRSTAVACCCCWGRGRAPLDRKKPSGRIPIWHLLLVAKFGSQQVTTCFKNASPTFKAKTSRDSFWHCVMFWGSRSAPVGALLPIHGWRHGIGRALT